MSIIIEEATRQQIAEFLPSAITKTLDSYQEFMMQVEALGDQKPKSFSEHHSACKAAISHLELLLKLARWADIPSQSDYKNQQLEVMLAQAKERVKNHNQSDK